MVATLSNLDREVHAGGSFTYVVKERNKLEEIEFSSDDAVVPDEEMYRCLEFYGVGTETYEVTFENETSTKLPILLRIIDESDEQHECVFKTSITFESAGPKSGIGQIFTCILGEPFTGKIDNAFWLTVLGGRFGAALKLKEKDDRTYVNLVHGSYKPVKQKASKKPGRPIAADEDPFNEE